MEIEFLIAKSSFYNTTISPSTSNDTLPSYTGFFFLIGSSILYGSNYLPVKQFNTGDGMFFQLLLCIGIWIVGFVLNCIRGFPKFYALPLFGGFLWSTGNNCVVPIISTIGMSLGMIFWNSVSLIFGWATGRFGLFGLKKENPANSALNYAGVLLVLLSTVFYLLIKTEKTSSTTHDEINETSRLIDSTNESTNTSQQTNTQDLSIYDRLSKPKKRILGLSLAVFSGLLYGQAFSPIVYIRDNYADASDNSLDYLFSFFTGILVASLSYFVLYAMVMKNKPVMNNELVLPGLVSGVMWGLANICYFLANNVLPQSIAFPIAASGPPIIGNLWGVFLYREITGRRNYAFLMIGFSVALLGAVFTGLSF